MLDNLERDLNDEIPPPYTPSSVMSANKLNEAENCEIRTDLASESNKNAISQNFDKKISTESNYDTEKENQTDVVLKHIKKEKDNKNKRYFNAANNMPPSNRTILDGLFGCIRPIISLWSNKSYHLNSSNKNSSASPSQDFNIQFEDLKDLTFLGSGAQGCVFRGILNKQEVAIKKVRSKEEANIHHLKRLNHENLVKFKGVSLNGANFYCIIMEYCPFGQLYTYLNSFEKTLLKPSLMMNWAKQISSGMNYLHLNKIIHRDLKSPK